MIKLLFIIKRLQHRYLPVKFAKFLRTPFFTEHLQWLLLIFKIFIVALFRRCPKNCFFLNARKILDKNHLREFIFSKDTNYSNLQTFAKN